MVQDGMVIVYPDGMEAVVHYAGKDNDQERWTIEKETGVTTWGATTLDIEQLVALHTHRLKQAKRLALEVEECVARVQLNREVREKAKADKEAAAALRKATNRKAKCITGTNIEKWQGVEVQYMDVVAWAAIHFTAITCVAPLAQFDALAANLHYANGQQFTPLMDGFRERGEAVWGIDFRVDLDVDLPENYRDEVLELQQRCGCRKDEDLTNNKRSIFCKEIAISLLQLGYKLGRCV